MLIQRVTGLIPISFMHSSTSFIHIHHFFSPQIKNIYKFSKTLEWSNAMWGLPLLIIWAAAAAELFSFPPFHWVFSLAAAFVFCSYASSHFPSSNQLQSWGLGALKDKAVLVKNLSKSGLIAKFNSKDPFWKLGTKMEPSIGLAVSRTPCPYFGERRRGRKEINLILLATMFWRLNTY